jgi:hypothetical protein
MQATQFGSHVGPPDVRKPGVSNTHRLGRAAAVLAVLALCLLFAERTALSVFAASEGAGCGYYETYGPYGVIAGGQPPQMLLGLTVCEPSSATPGIDDNPRINWGDGTGWHEDNLTIRDCTLGFMCKFYGSHLYAHPGTYTAQLRYYNGCCIYHTSDNITIDVYAGAPSSSVDPSNWMGALRGDIGDLPLNQVVIPGTHDSGAHGFTSDSYIAPDFPISMASSLKDLAQKAEDQKANCPSGITTVCKAVLDSFATVVDSVAQTGFSAGGQLKNVSPAIASFTADSSNAQAAGIDQQLNDGIRYLDLRLCAPVRPYTELTLCHGLYSDGISTVLGQIKQFVQAHPQEVVIVGLDRFIGTDGTDQSTDEQQLLQLHTDLIKRIRQTFSTGGSGACDSSSTCLLVPSSMGQQTTLNAILATSGRVILLDSDNTVVRGDQLQHPGFPVLWNRDAVLDGEWIQASDYAATYQSYVFGDLDCRCDTYTGYSSQPSKLFGIGLDLSPTDNWVTSTLVQRLIDTHGIEGPLLAKKLLEADGKTYFVTGADVIHGPILRARAWIGNGLNLNGIYDAVMQNPQLRKNVNILTTDWESDSPLVRDAIELNRMYPHRAVQAVTVPPAGNGTSYTAGNWSRFPVKVTFSCTDGNGTVLSQSPQTVNATTGTTLQSPTNCSSNGLSAPQLSFGPIKVDTTRPVISATLKTADGQRYQLGHWTNQTVTITFSCSETGTVQSGLRSGGGTSETVTVQHAEKAVTSHLECRDNAGNQASPVVLGPIRVDQKPPTCTVTLTPSSISVANGSMTTVTATLTARDAGGSDIHDRALQSITPSSGNAGDVNGWIVGKPDTGGQVRATPGASYTLVYTVTDQAGNTGTCSATVTVAGTQAPS